MIQHPRPEKESTDEHDVWLTHGKSMEEVCRSLHLPLVRFSGPEVILGASCRAGIGIHSAISDGRLVNQIAAHELGHWHLHSRETLYLEGIVNWVTPAPTERAAWEWARDFLVPVVCFLPRDSWDQYEIAKARAVTPEFVWKCWRSYLGQPRSQGWYQL